MMNYLTRTRNMLHIKELGPKGPRYVFLQHVSRPRYIIHHNLHKNDKYIRFFISRNLEQPLLELELLSTRVTLYSISDYVR